MAKDKNVFGIDNTQLICLQPWHMQTWHIQKINDADQASCSYPSKLA